MGERRKRKPLWDLEDEIKHLSGMREHNSWIGKDRHFSHGSGRYHEFSDSRSTFSRESRDHSGWRSWESIEHPSAPISGSFKNSPEGREMGGGKGYHKHVSPGFDGTESHTYDHTHEYDRSHPQRYMGRGRSRSRSRSRNRGRSRSRSLSRGRERVRVRGWSRSRSRSDGNGNDHRRSHSPIRDYRRQSYGLSDKRSGLEKSSLTCRDFTSGRCRKGSECRFFHPNSTSHRDDDLVEDDTVESWKSRADHSRIPKHSYTRSGFESRNDEQFPIESRSSAPCKDFMRGKCRWGDTCRFSHASPADSFGQVSRNMSFDRDFDHQQHKSGKPICKFFAAGKCDRDNCRFSHEGSNRNNQEGRVGEVTDSRSSHDKSTWRNASKWDDTMIADTQKPTGWGETIVTDTTSTDDTGNRQSDDKWKPWAHSFSTGNTGNRQNDDSWKQLGSTGDTGNRQSNDMGKQWGSTGDAGNKRNDETRKPSGSISDIGNRQKDDSWKLWGRTGDTGNRQNDDPRKPWSSTGDTGKRQNDDTQKPWASSGDTGNRKNDDRRKPWGSTGDSGNRQNDDRRKPWGSSSDTGTRQKDDAWKPWGSSVGTDNKQNDDGWGPWGYSSENEDKNRGIQEPTSNSLTSEKQPSLPGESRSFGGDTWPSEAIAEDIISNKQEHLILHGSQLQKQDEIVNLHGPIASKENQGFSVKALQQNVSPESHIQQQHCRVIENNPMKSFGSDVLDEEVDTRFSNHPILLPGESLNQNGISMYPGHSSISSGSDRGQNMLGTNPSNGIDTNLNGPEIHIVNPFNVQIHSQNNQKAVCSPVNVPQLITSMHTDQVTRSAVTTTGQHVSPVAYPLNVSQSFENEQSQAYSGIDVSSSRGVLPCLPSTGAYVQPNPGVVSVDLLTSMGNNREITVDGNDNLVHGTELNDQMQLKRSSPSSVLGTEFDGSRAKPPESPKQQEEIVANLGDTGGAKAMGEESKGLQDDKPSETLDGHVKPEDESANKDDKGMRVFKNALIEFVKEILKPTWKEGRMSREVHKTIVKKVVDKVSSTIQVEHMPKTQDKVEQYLSFSKPKISKLIQAYVERCQRADG